MSSIPKVITFDDGWERINRQGLSKLVEYLETGEIKNFSKKETTELYTIIYNMCVQRGQSNCAAQLYTNYGGFIRSYLAEKVLHQLQNSNGEEILTEMIRLWDNHLVMLRWLKKFFMYLERYHTHQNSLASLKEVGYSAFKMTIFDVVKDRLREAILEQIKLNREDEINSTAEMRIDPQTLKKVINIFVEMKEDRSTYGEDFEVQFIDASKLYFREISRVWMDQNFPEYIKNAEKTKLLEQERVRLYLHTSTEDSLMKAFQREVLSERQNALLEKESGIKSLLANKKTEDLARMFRLFSCSEDILKPVADAFRQYVARVGTKSVEDRSEAIRSQAVKDSVHDPTFIKGIIELHDEYKTMVNECFNRHALFERSLKTAFESFFNVTIGRYTTAELLSTFSDCILRKNAEKLSDEEIEDKIDKIVDLFSHLTDKDLFASSYRTKLAQRLLYEKSASDDAERTMITKLKSKCGAHFTKKLEGMISDLNIASDGRREYLSWMNENKQDNLNVEFTPTVLSSGYWPDSNSFNVQLPAEMERCIDSFTKYYEKTQLHKKLLWTFSYGTVTLAGYFDKRYDFVMTTYQACVLMLFAKPGVSIGYNDVKAQMNFDDDCCKRVLGSLCFAKVNLLLKNSDEKKIGPDDRYTVNVDFKSNKRKINLKAPPTEEIRHKERVEIDRTNTIEAAIVRIMKARKTLDHGELITEVLRQLSTFSPNVKSIKKTIEKLIEREFLERDSKNTSVYNYLA